MMKELLDVLQGCSRLRQRNIPAVLATVVDTRGSTYRKPGARMLLGADGSVIGMVSGGCLESDLRERIPAVLASHHPSLVTYDTTSPEDIVLGLGLGCGGVSRILLEDTSAPGLNRYFDEMECAASAGRPFASATVYGATGNPGTDVGYHLVAGGRGELNSAVSGPMIALLRQACDEAVAAGRSISRDFATATGNAEAFIEFVHPPMKLFVFGGGPGAVPLARFAHALGWSVTVIDTRPAILAGVDIPGVSTVLLREPAELAEKCRVGGTDAAVVMTHNFDLDFHFLQLLLPLSLRYLGLLGSRQKGDLLLSRLQDESASPVDRSAIYSPVGLDIGAEGPEEIALSIVAEIRAVMSGGTGGSLRSRSGAIHRLTLHA